MRLGGSGSIMRNVDVMTVYFGNTRVCIFNNKTYTKKKKLPLTARYGVARAVAADCRRAPFVIYRPPLSTHLNSDIINDTRYNVNINARVRARVCCGPLGFNTCCEYVYVNKCVSVCVRA